MSKKFTFDEVRLHFELEGCALLEREYRHSKQKLCYRCSCGTCSSIEFRNFRQGKRCQSCSRSRAMNTNRKNNEGVLTVQTSSFKKARKQRYVEKYGVDNPLKSPVVKLAREKTNMARYGVKHVAQSECVKKRQRESFMLRYGVEYSMQIPGVFEKHKATLMRNYGVPSMAYLGGSYSKASQLLFWELYHNLSPASRHHCYFAELNREFVIRFEGEYYKYDFVHSKAKLVIEFDGSRFHPCKSLPHDETRWCVFHPELTAGEARKKELKKERGMIVRGYKIVRVRDTEVTNPDDRDHWKNNMLRQIVYRGGGAHTPLGHFSDKR